MEVIGLKSILLLTVKCRSLLISQLPWEDVGFQFMGSVHFDILLELYS